MDDKRDEKILELVDILKNTKYLVFFGGAGTSTEITPFNYQNKKAGNYPAFLMLVPYNDILALNSHPMLLYLQITLYHLYFFLSCLQVLYYYLTY